MKRKIIAACLVLLLAVPAFALRSDRVQYSPGHGASIDFRTYIDANQILMFVSNKGSFAYDNAVSLGKADGLYFPYTGIENIENGSNVLSVIYAGSIWMGATVGVVHGTAPAGVGDTIITSGHHDTDWGPGPLIDGALPPTQYPTRPTGFTSCMPTVLSPIPTGTGWSGRSGTARRSILSAIP